MNEVFADTSGIYALLVSNDRWHLQARAILEVLERQQTILITSSYVLQETVALLQARAGIEAVRLFQQAVAPSLEVNWVSEDIYSRAMAALVSAANRAISLTDWSSFEIMRARGIHHAFAFDPHFSQQGFTLIPTP